MIHVFDDIFSNRKMYHFVHCCIDNPTHKMDIQTLTVYMYMYEAPSLHFQTAKNSIKNHPSTKCKQVAHSKRLGNLCSLPQEHIQKISEKSSGTFASSTPLMFGFPIIFWDVWGL